MSEATINARSVCVSIGDDRHLQVEVESGDGAPLLLLRPLGGDLGMWGPFRRALGDDVRVIVYAPPGMGRGSQAPATCTTRSLGALAAAVLDAVDVESAHVFGLSLGGMTATWLAADHPHRVKRLVLASTPVCGRRVSWSSLVRAAELGRCMVRGRAELAACLTRQMAHGTPPVSPERASMPGDHPRREILKLLLASMRHDASDALTRVAAPTLVLAGAEDRLIEPVRQRDLARRLPNARFRELAGAGHDVTLDAPDAVACAVREHILGPGGTR